MANKQNFPFDQILYRVPDNTLIEAMYEARNRAIVETLDMQCQIERIALFWLTYEFEFRQFIERWEKANGNVKT